MIFLILVALATVLALYIRHHYTFWQRKGFPVAGTSIPFGCMDSVVKRQKSFGMAIYDVYKNSTERFLGIYLTFRRALLIRDAELARQILVQDFPSFHDRGIYVDEENNPFSGQLFALKGERWKSLRTKLAPSFTSGKLKGMFGTIDDVGDRMIQHLDKIIPEKGGEATIEMKELLATYAIDIIGSVIFGLEVDSFKNPQNKFRTVSQLFSKPTFTSVVRSATSFLCPVVESLLMRLGITDEVTIYMKQMVRETVEFREKNNYSRKDMMQMLIQLRNTGKVNIDDNNWDVQSSADGFKSMSIESIAGQAFLFYIAGFDTSASAASFTIYELAQNPELLAKAEADIEQTLEKHDGKLTYECIQDMKFLDLCFMETIRKYPGLPILNRECTKDFKIPDSDKIIEKGTPIVISLFGIQRDPEYFPDPLKYDPERFLETSQNYNPVAYMPFGEGPRHCIAQRLGKINVKVAVVKILTNYDVQAIKKGEIEFDNFAVTIVPKGGINLKLRKKIKLIAYLLQVSSKQFKSEKMFLLILLGVISALAFYIHHVYTFWQRKGFPIASASKIPFGALESVVKRQRSFGMAINDIYNSSTERFLGIYLFFRPAILVRDAELARQMLVQDFASFHDRGVYCDEKNDPYSGNLFNLPGERWKILRTKLTPSFSSGKIKSMFGMVDDIGNNMLKYLDNLMPEEGESVIEMKEFFSRYAIDIIGSVIFGLEVNSFKDPNNPLQKLSLQFSKPTFVSVVRGAAAFIFPALEKLFVRLQIPNPIEICMKNLVRQTVEFREKNNFSRKDMMQMLIELRNTGKINLDEEIWQGQSTAENLKSMSIDCIAGQAFLFYIAGYDTTASTAAFTIFELAKYPEIYAKVKKDIQQAVEKHDGKITYESIQEMKYLDLCVMETVRKYTILPILNRQCTIDFPIPGSDKIIEKGTPIVISLFGIHRDPEYFPDPLKYDPERFVEETKNYNPIAYMPFGEGPRHCIAQRMGIVNVKVALAKVLMNYDIEAVQEGEIEIDNFSVTISAKGGVNVKLRKRTNVVSSFFSISFCKMFLLLLIGVLTLLGFLTRRIYTYWQRKGFPYYNTNIPFGCLNSVRKGKCSFGMAIYNVYNATSEKVIGIYLMFRPALLIRDAEIALDILVQNFNSFHDRGVYCDEVNDPFSANLFSLEGQKWKTLRGKMAPFFTPGKLKAMFPAFENVANRMLEHLDEENNDSDQVVELKSLFSRYVTDIIGCVIFGLDIDSFKEPKSEFQKITEYFRNPTFLTAIRNAAVMLCPKLEKIFFYLGIKHDYVNFVTEIVRQTVEYREKNNVIRRDMMQMLIQLRNTGEIISDDENNSSWDINSSSSKSKSMSIESIASQAFLFYIAGYETSATAAAYTIFELAKNPMVLEKLQMDIEENLEDGKLTYESIQNMKYLDLCFMGKSEHFLSANCFKNNFILETLRKYPILPLLNRQCTRDYRIADGTNKIIEKGTPILFSLLGLHRDPKYFPNPLNYEPERFLESNKNYDPKAYMPFGEGPRHCIAQQMGKLNVKVAVITILRNYNLEPVEMGEIEFDALTVPLMPKDGINVKLSKKTT
ncbi:uncharacterized protein LOC129913173 [Episyrphus balteatus]|uniref:uncharacterized protein LOC129913173 n=1 Tax=Episyrphus balteatus TaxID=286459 RepID=UPI00248669B5|nr:uncharacterized protein LOC129913173 [Episyrphus balteatus]